MALPRVKEVAKWPIQIPSIIGKYKRVSRKIFIIYEYLHDLTAIV